MESRLSYYDFIALIIPGVILAALLASFFNPEIREIFGKIEGDFLKSFSALSVFTAFSYCAGEVLYILGEQLEKILRLAGAFHAETDIVRLHDKQNILPKEVIKDFRETALKNCLIQGNIKIDSNWSEPKFKPITKYILTYGKLQARTYKNNRLDLFQSLAHFSRNLAALSFLMTLILPIALGNPPVLAGHDYSWLYWADLIFVLAIPYLPLILFLVLILLARIDNKLPISCNSGSPWMHATLLICLATLLYSSLRVISWSVLITLLVIILVGIIKIIAVSSQRRNESIPFEIISCLMLLLYTSFLSSSWLIRGTDYRIPYLFISIFLFHVFLIMNFTETFNRYFLELFCCINQSLSARSSPPTGQRDSQVQ